MMPAESIAVAGLGRAEYPSRVRAIFHFFVLVSVALLPLTSFAARAHTAADLTSSAVELEQGFLPSPSHQVPPPQGHHHCTLWVAGAAECGGLADDLLPAGSSGFHAGSGASALISSGPQAPTPPPKR